MGADANAHDFVSLPLREDGTDYDARFFWQLEKRDYAFALVIGGRVTRSVSDEFNELTSDALRQRDPERVVIDFSATEHISSTALSYLVQFFKLATSLGAQVVAISPSDHVRGLMQVLGMDGFLLSLDTEAQAREYFASQS